MALYGPAHANSAGRLADLGSTLRSAGRLEEARAATSRALDAAIEGFQPPSSTIAQIYDNLSHLELNLDDLDAAETSLAEADRWSVGLGGGGIQRLRSRGRIAEARGDPSTAAVFFAQALQQAKDDEDVLAATTDVRVAKVLRGEFDGARPQLLDVLDDPNADSLTIARAHYGLALLEARRGQPDTARRHIAVARDALLEDAPAERMLLRKLAALEHTLPPARPGEGQRRDEDE